MGGLYAEQKLQFGAESPKGTPVAATTIWRGHGMLEDARTQIIIPEQVGIVVPTSRIATTFLAGKLDMPATPATFEQFPYILEAGMKLVTPTQDGTGSDYIYAYDCGKTTISTTRSYTIEGGDSQAVEEMEYSQVEKFALSGKAGELLQMSATWFGRQLSDSSFTGSLSVPTVEEIIGAMGSLSIDDNDGSMGGTPVGAGSIIEFGLDVTTGWYAVPVMDSGELYFYEAIFDRDKWDAKLKLTWRHNAASVTEKGNWQNEVPRMIQLVFEGSAVTTPGTTYSNKTLVIEAVGVYNKFSALDKDGGDSIIKAEFTIGYDETADIAPLAITVVNELAALP